MIDPTSEARSTTIRGTILILLLVLLGASCATRLSREEIRSANEGAITTTDSIDGIGSGSARDTGGSGDSSAAAGPSSGEEDIEQRGGAQGRGRTGDLGSPEGPSTQSQGGGTTATGDPIVIGNVSTTSGPLEVARPAVTSLRVWAQFVNDRGGLNGHPVELITIDDEANASRHSAAVRDLVESHGAIAFVGQTTTEHPAAAAYLEERQVPVVGGDLRLHIWNESPMFFAQSTSLRNQNRAIFHAASAVDPGQNVGTLVCVEAEVCSEAQAAAREDAPRAGFEITYEGEASLGQPDYTAECLAARNADVDLFYVVMDDNSHRRVAESCFRQDFDPLYVGSGGTINTGSPQVEPFDGLVAALPQFPFLGLSPGEAPPAYQQYVQAHQQYAPDAELTPHSAGGWMSAKLFEAAAQNVSSTPTSAEILEGLWSMNARVIGGITPPLTFNRDEPSPHVDCYYVMRIQGGEWVAPRGLDPSCLS